MPDPIMPERGICTFCGIAHGLPRETYHPVCNADTARLVEIDREAGCGRTVREILIADGKKGFNNKIETLENEAIIIRARL